jgi:signal transduction histidine kinase
MDETELLRTIHPIWINRATLSLAKGAGVREDIRAQLDRFFELLVVVVDTGDPAWLDPLLSLWSTSLTETDLESGQSNMTTFLREIMLQTYQVCRETLDGEKALELMAAMIPAFAYSFEKAAFYEMQVRVAYISNQLKQVQSTLERLDRSKSDFIAVAAHELRTPLTLIEGYATMLRDSRDQNTMTALETELMNGISSGTQRLKMIIDDMIDVSMIDNNLMKLNFQPVWINRLLSILLTELNYAAKERRQELRFEHFPGCDEMTFADPERVLQVLRNVLTNAIKYTPDGGEILIEGRKLPGFLELIIRDSGIGIDPDDQSIIFEKFTRLGNISLHSSGKTKFKGGGPGLGLHIAKGIIEAHGGAIWVESPGYDEEKFPGSTFHILLPLHSVPPDSRMASLLSSLIASSTPEEKVK